VDWIDSILSGTAGNDGFAPGATPPPAGGEKRAVVRPRSSNESLSSVSGGDVVAGYVRAFNAHDSGRFFEFLEANASKKYLARKSRQEHLASYRRLRDQEFGELETWGVVQASSDRVVIRVAGSSGVIGEFHFTFVDGRIDDLMVAKIDAERR
jgi:hypothetical protein